MIKVIWSFSRVELQSEDLQNFSLVLAKIPLGLPEGPAWSDGYLRGIERDGFYPDICTLSRPLAVVQPVTSSAVGTEEEDSSAEKSSTLDLVMRTEFVR